MRAWRVPAYGPFDEVLEVADVRRPEPGEGQTRVRVEAAALNFADILYCSGEYQDRIPPPFTPGLEVAGVTEDGRRVFGPVVMPHGGFAEEAVLSTTWPWPEGMTAAQAAGFFVAYQTGWCALHHRTTLSPGETLLVLAAAGGVGAAAVQLGRAAGARVIAVVGDEEKAAVARGLGADEVLVQPEDLVTAVRELTDGHGADVVYDPVGGDSFDAARRVVAWEGRLLVIGFAGGRIAHAPTNHALVKNYAVIGVHWAVYRQRAPELVAAWQRELEAWARRAIDPLVGAEYAFDDLPAALTELAARRTTGRVVLRAP
ncbi:NADPH:quinone oxidoreductase family protein [Actinomycetospora cinnamomea]|uniref:NADPH:quinone reductase-like Zn-dependent oxidoreductase n=1 Tax=Actinomycetospora cinnamomea TaxID=663609 RepID=A0A2U1EUR7_9PSEU|nr:NADPH:quinone oxidoreductase family protein [Actinomycetospora cinnamomea]PVZ03667.1 NADPH:quinone reductase-like Zn-dependent oxidoreductase [Actinomycetospora cinnamomea]